MAVSTATLQSVSINPAAVIACIESTLLENLSADGFTIKLNSLGKCSVRHKRGILRKIPFTGQVKLIGPKRKIRFVSLGMLRRCETTSQS